MNDTAVAFYNDIYTKNPHKWSDVDRNYVAFKILSARKAEPERILDFGCGNGHTLAFFHLQWPDVEYTGIDLSDVALDIASRRIPDGEFYQEMPDGAWDIITIMGVAEHFENPVEELRRIAEHLAPGGLLYLEAPNCLAYSDKKEEGFRQTFIGAQTEWHLPRQRWEEILKEAGLEIVKGYNGAAENWKFIWVLKAAS